MTNLWLVRHGETAWSVSGRHTGRTDLPLTDHGTRQAERLKSKLASHRFGLVLSSPLKRAFDTCQLAGYSDVAVADADLLVFGHTHNPWIDTFADVLFVNCGSVGKPKDGDPRAAYAVLETTGDGVTARIDRVEYDAEAAANEVTSAGLPGEFAEKLITAS